MNTRRPQYCSIKVSGQNPTIKHARDYVCLDKDLEEQMESGFFEVTTMTAFIGSQDENSSAEVYKGSPKIITFSSDILLAPNPGFREVDL